MRIWTTTAPRLVVNALLANLPDASSYRPISHIDARAADGTPTRYVCPLESLDEPFWRNVNRILCSDGLRMAIMAALGVPESTPAHPSAALIRDLPGYFIRPHTDTPRKLVSAQLYLASDDTQPHLGLRLYNRQSGGFEKCGLVPYLPGQAYAFKVSPDSWHGVELTTLADGVRNSLMLVYYRRASEHAFD